MGTYMCVHMRGAAGGIATHAYLAYLSYLMLLVTAGEYSRLSRVLADRGNKRASVRSPEHNPALSRSVAKRKGNET
ncbi:hypothetical protein F4782DRAFT_497444 [Xylaria castorea]|nr:hypothetical protein F4782DRAFT_497444 [Xylaria castorea]